jgi:hypothetical protein
VEHTLVRAGPIRILQVDETDATWYEIHDGEQLVGAWWDPTVAFDIGWAFLQRRQAEERNATGRGFGEHHSPRWHA